ncbi:DUF4911 domain-containing protein [Thermosulfurimonas sp. F29]|uniref:DUF4911 domain-containing protein n=1 Tax=Thermosulfurimonas sp. F29 TaxID=2867247 RepID=UPI001C828C55|nr:DUF4911 domain-containing protein [Thermosulfurimonas sp. F29]MBX6422408.1 DUF4911 domain-containing protein [Thermosulfurimonas sp. F29]
MESAKVELRVNPRRLSFLRFLLEGFGHLALPVTLSGREGRVLLLVHPDEEERLRGILRDLDPWLT